MEARRYSSCCNTGMTPNFAALHTAFTNNVIPSRSAFFPSHCATSARPAQVRPQTVAGRAPLCPCTRLTIQAVECIANEAATGARLVQRAHDALTQCQNITWDGTAAAAFKRVCASIQTQTYECETQMQRCISEVRQWL